MKNAKFSYCNFWWTYISTSLTHFFFFFFGGGGGGGGWSGGAKMSCILCHRGVQLILAYSWARPAILVAGKGREVMFLFLLFLHFHSCSSFFPVPLFHLFCYLFCLFSPFLWETTQNDPQGLILIVLGFNDTSTLVGHFVSSPREREKSDRRDSRRD